MSFSPGKPVVLELMGDLNKVEGRLKVDFINPSIILGISSQGKLITLYKCTQTQSTTSIAGFPTTNFYSYLRIRRCSFIDER